jgi:hypothetical protein
MNCRALSERDLCREVCRGPKPVDAKSAAGRKLGPKKRAIADDSRAEEGRRLHVGERVRDRIHVILIRNDIRCKATFHVPTSEGGRGTEVLTPSSAIAANSTGAREPRHANALSNAKACRAISKLVDYSNNFVTRRHEGVLRREIALGQVQIGPADTTRPHRDPKLRRTRYWHLALHLSKRVLVDWAR